MILDREVASLISPGKLIGIYRSSLIFEIYFSYAGLSSNRFQVNVADAPLHEAGSGSHVRHAYFPANADLYLLVGAVNEWNYRGDDEIVALLQNIHTVCRLNDSLIYLIRKFACSRDWCFSLSI